MIPKLTVVQIVPFPLNNKPGMAVWTPGVPEQPGLQTTHRVCGVTMTDASDEEQVAVMRRGYLRGCSEQNGETWAVGDLLWGLGDGSVSNVRPDAPHPLVIVGVVFEDEGSTFAVAVDVRALPSLGELSGVAVEDPANHDVFVYDSSAFAWVPRQLDHGSDIAGLEGDDHPQYKKKHGFERSGAGAHLVTISYDKTTRKITVTPTGSTFDVWIDGVKFTKTGAQLSGAHSNATAKYFFTYDNAGVLQVSTSVWSVVDRTKTPVALVYYYNPLADGVCFAEYHGSQRNLELHRNLHSTQGTKRISGFALSGYTLDDVTSDASITYAIAAGVIADEDIFHSLSSVPDNGPYTVFYRTGAAGDWTWDKTPVVPFLKGATYIQYNAVSGGNWGMQSSQDQRFLNYYLCAVPSTATATQLIHVPGQFQYTSLSDAEAESLASLDLGSLPFEEIAPLYKLTYRVQNANGTSGKARLVAVTAIVAGGASVLVANSPSVHNALSGRSEADSHPASAITFTPYGTLAATQTQAAIEELHDTVKTFERGGVFLNPTTGLNVVIWRAPYACTVLNVRGYRNGGSGATLNARKNGSSTHLASDLSLTSDTTWTDGGSVQNATYAAGDYLEIMLQSVSGTPSQVAIQVDFERA